MTQPIVRKIVREKAAHFKKRSSPVGFIHFGSSVYSKQFFVESDIDLMAIVTRKPKESLEVDNKILGKKIVDVATHIYSKKEFTLMTQQGHPLAIMALQFGRIIYDPTHFLQQLKQKAKPTEKTGETWLDNALRTYSFAIMGYFSRSCVGCYLKDVHHAARTFLRAYILQKKGILCQRDEDILSFCPRELCPHFQKIINARKKGKLPGYEITFWIPAQKAFKDKIAELLLSLEKIVTFTLKELKNKKIYTLQQTAAKIKGKIHTFVLGKNYGIMVAKKRKWIELPLYKK